MLYEIKRNNLVIATVRPEGGQQKEIMVQDIVAITFKTSQAIHFMHGDYIDVWGERYTLNYLSEPTMNDANSFEYKMTFQAQYYALAKWKFKFYNSANELKEDEFDLMNNASGFLDLIVANANRLGSGWTKGEVLVSDYQNLSFSGENILQALSQLAEAFDTEWRVVNKVIHLIKKVAKSPYTFKYGYDQGLRGGLTRSNADSSSVFSRLYVYGSDKNLPIGYKNGAKRLSLPNPLGYIQGPLYGSEEIEASITFDDVMPDRIGTVTSVGTIYTFSDSSIDFDVNAQVYSELSAKVEFQTGSLAGYQFELAKGGYNAGTKTVTFLKNNAETAFILPSDTLKPKVGDKYKFIDIAMPQSYVDTKEAILMARGQDYFDKESKPKVTYTVPPDHFFFTRKQIRLNLGDTAHITAFDLLLDGDIRMIGFERDLHDEFKYTSLSLSNTTVTGAAITRDIAKEEKIDKALAQNQVYDIARTRRNAATISEVKNFMVDPDGKYYGDMFRANSIETLSLAVGSKWTNFSLKGVAFNTNAGGNPNSFSVKAGQLVHYALQIDGVGFVWELSPLSVVALDPAKTYYVYAKVSRNALTGTWVVTDQIINVESVSGFWHFQTGVLFMVTDGRRDYEFTHGMTYIIGDQITAGILKSLDGLNFINLTNGTANFGTTASGWDFGISAANKFSIRGALIQSGSGVVSPLPSYRGIYLPETIYYKGDTVLSNGTQWIYVNSVSMSGQTPADNAFWDVYASAGGTGATGLGSFTLVNKANMTIVGNTITKTSGTGTNYDGSAKSLEGYTGGVAINFTVVNGTSNIVFGLNSDPDTDDSYTSIDYGLSILFNGTLRKWESNVQTVLGINYVAGDNFSIVYNGKNVTYSKNGVPFSVVPAPAGLTLYMDSSFNTLNGSISNITFTPLGAAGNYTQFIYQKNGSTTAAPALTVTDVNPAGWSVTQPALNTGEYLWMTSAVKSGADNSLVGTWAVPLRTNGIQGATGAALANTGNYSATKEYHGTAIKVEATFYNGNWYITRTDAGTFTGVTPTNTTKWNNIGAQFDSIATDLLLANASTIDNLTVRNVKTSDTSKRIEINGDNNSMIFYDDTKTTEFPNGREVFRLDDNIDTGQTGNPLGGIMAKTPAGDVAYCTGNGLFANGAGMQFLSATTGKTTNASVVGIARYKNTDPNGITAGVVGFDQSDGTGNSKSYGMACIGNTMITGEVHLNLGGTIKGFTGYELISSSGPQTRKYINGFYIGQGPNDSW